MTKKSLYLLLLTLGGFFYNNSFALFASKPYTPRLYLGAYAGTNYLGQADLLAPILQNYNYNLFLYAEGRYSFTSNTIENNSWVGSVGLGYRHVFNKNLLLGLYGLADYNNIYSHEKIFSVNPGVELLTQNWDVHVNGYFPLNKTKWSTSGWADDFGDYQYVKFSGHDEYDHWYTYHAETGIGTDAEVGRTLFTLWDAIFKGYLSGYYFKMDHNDNLRGGGAKLTIQPKTYLKFSFTDTYDNYANNTFMMGLEVSIYDLLANPNTKPSALTLQHKLYQPLERNFGQIAIANNIATTMNWAHPEDHGKGIEKANIWYFADNSSLLKDADNQAADDGTYEHPYTAKDFNNSTLNDIKDYAKAQGYAKTYLYFSPGTYNAYNFDYAPIELYPNQNIEGRMGGYKGFKYAATGSNRPILIGALNLDNNTAISNIRLLNSEQQSHTAITINNAKVALKNVTIGANDFGVGYITGIKMQNNSSLNITDSTIYGYNANKTGEKDAMGIQLEGGGSIDAKNSTIYATTIYNNAYALYLTPNAQNNITVDHISGSGSTTFDAASPYNNNGYGIYASVKNNINIGKISGVKFAGNRNSLRLRGENITLGDITNSIFEGDYSGASILAYNKAEIGTIENSTFESKQAVNFSGFGISAKQIHIGNISNSNFNGPYEALDISGNIANIGNISNTTIDGMSTRVNDLTIGNITDTTFNNNVGLYNFNTKGSLTIGDIKNSNFKKGLSMRVPDSIVIGNIVDSQFAGQGLYAHLTAGTNSKINIGTISHSEFSGNGTGGIAGFHIKGANQVYIKSIENNSIFSASGTNSSSFAIDDADSITIDNISNSTFGNGADYGIVFSNIKDSISINNYSSTLMFDPDYVYNILMGNYNDITEGPNRRVGVNGKWDT